MSKKKQNKIQAFIINAPIVKQLIEWTKHHSVPGFSGIPIYNIAIFISKELQDFDINTRANSMAFSFFLALFPAIIALFTLVAYFPVFNNFQSDLQTEIQNVMPGNAGAKLFETIAEIATKQRGGLLSLGFLLAVFFASNGMMSMMRGFDKSYPTFLKRNVFQKRLVAIQLTFLLAIILVASVLLAILGKIIINFMNEYIGISWFLSVSLDVLRWVVLLFLYYSGISIIYRYGAAIKKKFGFLTTGATVATILSILSSVLFSFYVDNFGAYDKLYGSIGTIIVLMLWIQINATILLIGFELNVSIAMNREIK